MLSYQFVLYGDDGAVRHVSVDCLDDKHALTIARVFAFDHRVEIFCDMRRVAVLGDRPRYLARTSPSTCGTADEERPKSWIAIWTRLANAFKRSE